MRKLIFPLFAIAAFTLTSSDAQAQILVESDGGNVVTVIDAELSEWIEIIEELGRPTPPNDQDWIPQFKWHELPDEETEAPAEPEPLSRPGQSRPAQWHVLPDVELEDLEYSSPNSGDNSDGDTSWFEDVFLTFIDAFIDP